jgi:hypothetical protein|eukprot:COSAG01_NODE_2191_length_8189_cov_23.683768_8_plen_80_part_00
MACSGRARVQPALWKRVNMGCGPARQVAQMLTGDADAVAEDAVAWLQQSLAAMAVPGLSHWYTAVDHQSQQSLFLDQLG